MPRIISPREFARKLRTLPTDLAKAMNLGTQKAAIDLASEVKRQIIAADAVASGEMAESVDVRKKLLRGASVVVDTPYARYVNDGTRPHMPPVEPLKQWAIQKGLARDEREADRIAWAVAKKIARDGTRPRHFMEKAMAAFKAQDKLGVNIRPELGKAARIRVRR
jgi:hypothetical protein